MDKNKFVPSEGLVRKAGGLVDIYPSKLLLKNSFGRDIKIQKSLKKEDIDKIRGVILEMLYGSVATLCYRNLAFENMEEAERDKYTQILQVKDNPKLSIISDSREKFNSGIEEILNSCVPINNPESISIFLKELNKEFYDYVNKTGKYIARLGTFYLDSGKIYFKTEESLPISKPGKGESIVVGGIGFKTKNAN